MSADAPIALFVLLARCLGGYVRHILAPGESYEKGRRAFENGQAGDWVVISAITSDQKPGFVEVVATLGGKRGVTEERRYLIPSGEYRSGRYGFVIEIDRHSPYDIRRAS